MKTNFAIMALLLSQAAAAAATVGLAPVKHPYLPKGFDSNDSVEIVVTGHFSNPCFSRNTATVQVVDEKINVEITALSPEDKKICPDMVVPFKEVVSVGNLQGGNYEVTVNNELKGKLTVVEAESSAVDEHIYAAIDAIEAKGNGAYQLKGWRYSGCVVLDKVEVVNNGADTFSVLPIMKQITDFCPMKMMPVTYDVNIDTSVLPYAEPLIHVRTMDGKSFNTILNFPENR